MKSVGAKGSVIVIEFDLIKIISPVIQIIGSVDDCLEEHFRLIHSDFKTLNEMVTHFLEFNYRYSNHYGEDIDYTLINSSKSNGFLTVSVFQINLVEFTPSTQPSYFNSNKNKIRHDFNNFNLIAN